MEVRHAGSREARAGAQASRAVLPDGVAARMRDPGRFQPVAFMLHWSPAREARVRVAWERFESYTTAEEILPAAAIHALEAGESVLVLSDGLEIESEDR